MSDKDLILNHLTNAEAPLRAVDLAKRIGKYNGYDLSQPSTRALIKQLINEGHPIASCNEGYFLIQNQAQLDEYVESLQSRTRGIMRRITSIKLAFANKSN